MICTFPSKHYDIEQFPAVKDWLINGDWVLPKSPIGTGKLRLEQTGAEHIVGGIKFKSRKKTNNKWFETQDSINYWDDFSKPKIVWASVGETYYSLVPPDIFLLDTNYFFTTNVPYAFLALLNSKIITDYINCLDIQIGNSAYRHYKYNIEKVPLIPLSTDQEKLLSDKVKNFISTGDRQILLDIENTICVLYNLSEEEKSFILTNFAR